MEQHQQHQPATEKEKDTIPPAYRTLDFEELYARYDAALRRYVARILPNPDDREEAIQDGWVKIWKSLSQTDEAGFQSYAYTVMRNTAIDYYRARLLNNPARADGHKRKWPRPFFFSLNMHEAECIDPCPYDPERAALIRERQETVDRLIASLPAIHRQALDWFLWGYSHQQIEERFGVSASASKTRRGRAVAALEKDAGELRADERRRDE